MGGMPAPVTPGLSQWGTLATWAERAVAFLIDIVIVAVPAIALYIIAIIFGTFSSALFFLVAFVAWAYSIVGALYVIGFQNGLGASPGKKITGLRLVSDETGQIIGGGMGIVRHFAHIVDSLICYIGWFFPLWDVKRQTIADKIMKTVVTSGNAKTDFATAVKSVIPGQT
jgi:uncharacterized RDD family membrane protein YckC